MRLDGIGLVCSGRASQSFLARMPSLLARLGPIKAPSFRVSRQVANQLRAGYAASHYSVLETCPMVWFATPEQSLDRVLRDFAAQTPIRCTMVVLCNAWRDSRASSALSGLPVRVASLNPVPDSNERVFVGEGHPATVRALRTLLAEDRCRLIELKPGTKPLFFAGVQASAPLLLPWLKAGMESLRASGFTRAQAAAVGELLALQTVRNFAKAGAKAWNAAAAAELRHALEHELSSIRDRNPGLAELYEQGIRIALKQL